MKRFLIHALIALAAAILPAGLAHADDLVIYSGRSKSLVDPIIKLFEKESGVSVEVRYGDTAQLTVALQEEGKATPADLFWAQDAGALGAMSKAGAFTTLSGEIVEAVPAKFRNSAGHWVATSGRARTIAYAPARVKPSELPASVFDLTDPKWKGRIGWAPSNGSFQAFVTAMEVMHGREKTLAWLKGYQANEPKAYPNNTAQILALAAGEIDAALPNHYYLVRFKQADKKFPVEQKHFAPGDVGNLVNVAGVGILKASDNQQAATAFVKFLLSDKVQQYFTSAIYEYPVVETVIANDHLEPLSKLLEIAPNVDLNEIDDLSGTLDLLREAGIR